MSRATTDESALQQRVAALEAQLHEQSRQTSELKNQDALKTQFLANISHDLRTPLTAVITHAEILRDGILGPISDRQRESIVGIIGGGRQLLEMVGEILTYARGAANQLSLSRSQFAVEAVIDQVCEMSESLVARKEHSLTVDLRRGLPRLYADREKLTHVLSNLLGNAIDFTPPGGRVWIAARLADSTERGGGGGQAVLFEVGDSGIGIAPEHHEFVFREFAQVDASSSRIHHGTGLGLAITRKFVELHDGRIWVESVVHAGSRFFFTIPVRPAPEG